MEEARRLSFPSEDPQNHISRLTPDEILCCRTLSSSTEDLRWSATDPVFTQTVLKSQSAVKLYEVLEFIFHPLKHRLQVLEVLLVLPESILSQRCQKALSFKCPLDPLKVLQLSTEPFTFKGVSICWRLLWGLQGVNKHLRVRHSKT